MLICLLSVFATQSLNLNFFVLIAMMAVLFVIGIVQIIIKS